MATVINNPSTSPTVERTMVERTDDSNAGWAVAVIILLAIVAVGGFVWLRYHSVAPAAVPSTANSTENINVTVPGTPNTGSGNTGPAGTGGVNSGTANPPTQTQTTY